MKSDALEIRRLRFSIRHLFAITFLVSALIIVAIEFGGMVHADGGGDQAVTILLSDTHEISELKYALIQHDRNTTQIFDAFASNDPLAVYEFTSPEMIETVDNIGNETELVVRQQWSFTQMGFTRRRPHYTQTFSKLVLHVQRENGNSTQHVVELPEYNRTTIVDLSKQP